MFSGGGSHHLPPIGNQHVNPLFAAKSRGHRNGWSQRRNISRGKMKQPFSSSSNKFNNTRFSRFRRRDEIPRYVSPRSTKRKIPHKDKKNIANRRKRKLRIGITSVGKPKSKSLPTDILRKTYPERARRKKRRRRRTKPPKVGEGDPKYPSLVASPPPSFKHGLELEEEDLTQSFPEEDLRKALHVGLAIEGGSKRSRAESIPIQNMRQKSVRRNRKKKLLLEEHPKKSRIYRESEMYKDLDQVVDTFYSRTGKEIEEMIGNQSPSSDSSNNHNNNRKKKRKKRNSDEYLWVDE